MKEIIITSNSFNSEAMIPSEYSCDGTDISPHLSWTGAPEETKSFALICDDPDAPIGIWVHWVLFNIPGTTTEIPENFLIKSGDINGAQGGVNDYRKLDYGGPCPPSGTHRYFFKIYALDAKIKADEGITKKELLNKMNGHIIGQGELMGRYKRKG